ncbi:MAG: energy transducer TonB [Bacteroidia bacterium]
MELKKNPNVDVSKDRTIYRALGFASVLVFTFIMFSFTFFEKEKRRMAVKILSDDAETVVNTQHNVPPPPPPPPPVLTVVENTEEETAEIQSTEFEEKQVITAPVITEPLVEKPVEIIDNKIYEGELEKKVDFKGGEEALGEFLSENLVYPEAARANEITGVIMVTFVIERNGTISNIKTNGKGNKDLENEAIAVIKKTNGMWIPGEYKKKPVRSICRIPITFEIYEDDW